MKTLITFNLPLWNNRLNYRDKVPLSYLKREMVS